MLAIKKWGGGGGGAAHFCVKAGYLQVNKVCFVFWPRVFVYATLMLSSCGDPMWLTGHNNPVTDRL